MSSKIPPCSCKMKPKLTGWNVYNVIKTWTLVQTFRCKTLFPWMVNISCYQINDFTPICFVHIYITKITQLFKYVNINSFVAAPLSELLLEKLNHLLTDQNRERSSVRKDREFWILPEQMMYQASERVNMIQQFKVFLSEQQKDGDYMITCPLNQDGVNQILLLLQSWNSVTRFSFCSFLPPKITTALRIYVSFKRL